MTKKVLIMSDIHGRVRFMSALKDKIEEEKPDLILGLGDFLYHGPRNGVPDDYDPIKVGALLKPYKSLIVGIRGNCDSRVDEMILAFKLFDVREMELFGKKAVLFHGDEYSAELLEKKYELYVFGHTHLHLLDKRNGSLFFNPGSVGFPKEGQLPSYGIMDEKEISIRSLGDGSPLAKFPLSAF